MAAHLHVALGCCFGFHIHCQNRPTSIDVEDVALGLAIFNGGYCAYTHWIAD